MKPSVPSVYCIAAGIMLTVLIAEAQAGGPPQTAKTPKAEGLLQYVNILQGTDSTRDFSHGNTLPLVGTPWGMTDWSPQTSGDNNARWFFQYRVGQIVGFRATHQPSPWMADYGNFMIMPETGPLVAGAQDRAAITTCRRASSGPTMCASRCRATG